MPPPSVRYSGGANWAAIGDLNGDGIADVALTDVVGVKVLFRTGAPTAMTFAAPVALFSETSAVNVTGANLIAVADVDGDGLNDLVITDPGPSDGSAPGVVVLLQNSSAPGQFRAPVGYATAQLSLAQSIIVEDVNGDGHPDIVIGGTEAVSVLLQNAVSPGTFLAVANYPAPDANQLAVADINGDGRVDIVVATGVSHPEVDGVFTNTPGMLLQSAAAAGTFGTVQDLP